MPRLPPSLFRPLRLLSRPTPSPTTFTPRLALRPFSLLSTPSLTSSLFRPTLSPILSLLSSPSAAPGQTRFVTYGAEYQPSQVRRKRKHGFLCRKRTRSGRKTLERRWGKGRKFLSH